MTKELQDFKLTLSYICPKTQAEVKLDVTHDHLDVECHVIDEGEGYDPQTDHKVGYWFICSKCGEPHVATLRKGWSYK